MLDDLGRIRKRLGGERHALVEALMRQAFQQQWQHGELRGHREWIASLLEQYYDPMYEYQLQQRAGRVLFRGNREQLVDWVAGQD